MVIKPENYSNEKSYPLVILLHGWSGDYSQLSSIVNLEDLANSYNLLLSCPDGFYNSWYINSKDSSENQYEDFFWQTFIPFLTKNYSIDSNYIFITGLSMGGHGAATLYFKRPEFFKGAASTSGILDITKFPENWEIKEVIGEYKNNIELWERNSAYYLLGKTEKKDLSFFIDCGLSDFAYEVNLDFVKRCYEKEIKVKFISVPGDHNKNYWKRMIPLHFEFFSEQINNETKNKTFQQISASKN